MLVWGLAVTHHHPDHIGGIEEVLSTFPSASLVAHADEKPFLIDGVSTGTLPSTNMGFRLMAILGLFNNKKPVWPVDRVCNADLALGFLSLKVLSTPWYSGYLLVVYTESAFALHILRALPAFIGQ